MQGGWFSVSTLGFAAEDTDSGDEGYVVTGHLGNNGNDPTPVGLQMWQPSMWFGQGAGEVEQTGGTYADASWVPYDNVEAKIYLCGTEDYEIIRPVTGYREEPDVGDTVFKSGIATGLTMGTVGGKADAECPAHGTLHDQYYADFSADFGDSGSPVYIYTYHPDDPEREIVGIFHGWNGDGSWFSPVSGVRNDLGVEPLTE